MKLTIRREELAAALESIAPAIPTRTTLPVLSNVALEAGDGTLVLRGSDLDTTAITAAECKGEEPGGVTVPAKALMALLDRLPEGPIEMESRRSGKESVLEVRADGGAYHFNGLPLDEAPEPPVAGTPTATLTIPRQVLHEVAERVAFCRSNSESRPALHGIHIHAGEDGSLRFVAANGHRMAWVAVDGVEVPPEFAVTLQHTAVKAASRLFACQDLTVQVDDSNYTRLIGEADGEVVSRNIEGFPTGYRQVVPAEEAFRTIAVIRRGELIDVIRRAEVLASDQTHRGVFAFTEGVGVTLSTDTPYLGASSRRVACDVTGPDLRIGANLVYLREILNALGGDEIRMKMIDPDRTIVFEPVAERPFNVRYLLMPLRLLE